jgi:pteridine reductase
MAAAMNNTTQENQPFVLVTGASRRLGRAIALYMGKHGYGIGLHYNASIKSAQETAEEIRALGAPVVLLKADLRKPEEITAIFSQFEESGYRLQALVNSAAEMQRGDLLTTTVDEWDSIMQLNLRAPWLCAQNAARLMKTNGGAIVNITDVGAKKNWKNFGAYTISKSGLEMLTRLLALTLAPTVRVNAVAPGLVLPSKDLSEEEWNRLIQRTPLRKSISPEAIAATVLFLIENEAITGQVWNVDGGYQLI